MAEDDRITAKQIAVINVLLMGKTYAEAATVCKVGDRTIYRWLKDPVFCKAFSDARSQAIDHGLTILQSKFDKAVSTLDRHTDSEKTIPRDQNKAAEVIIDKTLQTAELTKRISELEAELEKRDQDLLYKVVFDLRLLSKEDRVTLEEIHGRSGSNEKP